MSVYAQYTKTAAQAKRGRPGCGNTMPYLPFMSNLTRDEWDIFNLLVLGKVCLRVISETDKAALTPMRICLQMGLQMQFGPNSQ